MMFKPQLSRSLVSRAPRQYSSLFQPLVLSLALTACGGGSDAQTGPTGATTGDVTLTGAASPSAAAALGEKIFNDQALSVSGKQSCATCHVARFAFAADPTGPDEGLPVPLGGPLDDAAGFRNAPSLAYATFAPDFFFDSDGSPNGGFFRDGRAATLSDQAIAPFTDVLEMANENAAAVIAKLRTRPYFTEFVALFGSDVLDDVDIALHRVGQAIAAYETEDSEFHSFSSKYDYFLVGKAQLSARELRGLALFNNPAKGNCAACHPSTSADGITPPLFTDFSYDNLGVPRNTSIPANADTPPAGTPVNSSDGTHPFYDLGICGPIRDNPPGLNLSGVCGQFKVPTLRNVALTAPYFHNGRFATLLEALKFYVRRDTHPAEFYPLRPDGTVIKFDDLPAAYGGQFIVTPDAPGSDARYLGNVNTGEIPYNRVIGDEPALSMDEVNDVITFLCTLTDGYDPNHPAAQVLPAHCQEAAAAAQTNSDSRISSP